MDEFENNPQTEDISVDCLFAYEQLIGAMQVLEWSRDVYFDELELDAALKIDSAIVTLRHSLNWDRLWTLNMRASTPTPDDDDL